MSDTKIITPIAVRATSVSDPANVRLFSSLYAAKVALAKEYGIKVHHDRIRKDALAGKEVHGFKWELVSPPEAGAENSDTESAEGIADDRYLFTFRENVESIFTGGKVRVTDETKRRVSVYDIIRVVTGVKNPHDTYRDLCARHADILAATEGSIYTFAGTHQKPTPVCTAEEFMVLVNMLPGQRAMQFRVSAAKVLVRFLAGDQTLHAEIDENAERQAAQPAEHPMQIMSEHVANPELNRACSFLSPNMAGKRLGQFNKTPLVYLLRFEHGGTVYAKVGFSRDILERMKKHIKELPGCQLYTLVAYNKAEALEQEFKEQFTINRVHLNLDGRTKTELFIGYEMPEFEAALLEMQQALQRQDESSINMIKTKALDACHRALDMIDAGKIAPDSKWLETFMQLVKANAV